MSRSAVLVSDSSSVHPELASQAGVTVVPLQVVIGSTAYDEGPAASPEDVAKAMRQRTPVSTSRPTPHAFAQVYEQAARDGADAVVSIHLSGEVSGTCESASMAARDASIPVHVVDSGQLGMGAGFCVLAAAEALDAGATAEVAASSASARGSATTTLFYVDTLEYLRRGGRVGAAAAFVGSALAVKPLLTVRDGRIVPVEKVRTAARALQRLEELATEAAGDSDVDIAVSHLANPEPVAVLAEKLRERVSSLNNLVVTEVGAVIGAHAGPGMVAVVVAPRLGATIPPA